MPSAARTAAQAEEGDDAEEHRREHNRGQDQAPMALTTPRFLDDSLLEVLKRRWRGDQPEQLDRFQIRAIDATLTSITLPVKIDRADPTLLHDQVAAEIRRAIADGEAKTGERLPPARDLAAVIGVNTNTVLRALRLLRDEGLLEFRRGHGVRVAGTPERGAVIAKAAELVRFARQHGYRRDELLDMIQSLP
jgi:GntR family transcriptional regulator